MIPESIKIGCYNYTVEKSTGPLIVDHRSCKGKIDYENAKIEILDNGTTGEQSQEQTFWHEVIHGIVHDRSIDIEGDEEILVDEIAKGIYALLKDNKFPLPGQTV